MKSRLSRAFGLTLFTLYACGKVSHIGHGTDPTGEAGTSGVAGTTSGKPEDEPSAGAPADVGSGGSSSGPIGGGGEPSQAPGSAAGGLPPIVNTGHLESQFNGAGKPSNPPEEHRCFDGKTPLEPEDVSEWPAPIDDCASISQARREYRDQKPPELDVAPLAGTWVDELGVWRVELILDAKGAGTLLYGEPRSLPPIEDPREPYLTTVGERDAGASTINGLPLFAGKRYAVRAESGRGSEMTFAVSASEAWSEWCAQQEPILSADCYGCEHNLANLIHEPGCGCASSLPTGTLVRMHCGRALLCLSNGVCSCDENECFSNPTSSHVFTVAIDPVDTSVLRFRVRDGVETTYLEKRD